MPSVSPKQRIAMAIAEHHPDELHAGNRGMLKMSQEQLRDFAAGPVETKKKTKVMAKLAEMSDDINP